ncbi:MAG: UDP-N-acetylglucosamine 2-epimerase (hydrolyzing) [Thiotrichales bacterium]|nr:UDP-N-acetylglucosamine 2-epimerase (hydrolyzing) [Thiotrichales bacterium]
MTIASTKQFQQTQNRRKIAVVTATRAEYGLLSHLIGLLEKHPDFELQLYVTGGHLSDEQGYTVERIRQDGHPIAAEVPILTHSELDTPFGISKTTAKALEGFALVFEQHRPDAVFVLGDRYELLGICSAALLANIPIFHLHGGEVSEGAVDDAIRHAVTKMASLHFVAAEPYRQRVIQMGEQPDTVFNVGAPGLDVIHQIDKLPLTEIETFLEMSIHSPIFLVTYHPVSWGETQGQQALENLFNTFESLKTDYPDMSIIWTASNTDVGGHALNQRIQQWVVETEVNAEFVTSLGSQRYLSLMGLCDVVVGNSSSGIIEAPAVGTPTVNIGERQKGRLMADSIIQCDESTDAIIKAIQQAMKSSTRNVTSLYGKGDTAQQILQALEKTDFDTLLPKRFYDIPYDVQS